MNYKEFVMSLKTLKHVYLLSGAEDYYIDHGVEEILSRLFKNKSERDEGLVKLDCDKKIEIGEIINAIQTTPFFTEKNVVLIKNTNLFKAKNSSDDDEGKWKSGLKLKGNTPQDRLAEVLSDMLETNYVIFTTKDNVDKRKKLYKTVSKVGIILEANPLRHWEIDNWLDYTLRDLKKDMDKEARTYFIERISMLPEISLNYLENELKKTALYVLSPTIKKKDLQLTMAEPPELSAFALINALSEKNLKKAMYLLESQINEKKEIPLIALLVRNVKLMLRAKYYTRKGIQSKELAAKLELNPYIANKTAENAKKFSDKVLEEVFLMLADADYFFKTGKAGSEFLERIIFKLVEG